MAFGPDGQMRESYTQETTPQFVRSDRDDDRVFRNSPGSSQTEERCDSEHESHGGSSQLIESNGVAGENRELLQTIHAELT